MMPRFSIVIPAYNEEFELPRTLHAFDTAIGRYRAGGGGGEFEFILVDNASTDRTAQIAAEWGARVVFEPYRQIARARNTGARAATGELLITCDADSRPHPDIFLTIDRRFTARVFAMGVRIWALDIRWSYLPSFLVLNLIIGVGRFPAGMFILRRNDFLELGGFDERLYALEDVNLSRRIKARAHELRMQVKILWRQPIYTSTRKFRMVRMRDFFRLMARYLMNPRGHTRRKENWEAVYYASNLREN